MNAPDFEPALVLKVGMPGSDGQMESHFTIGDPNQEVKVVQGWMLEAIGVAIALLNKYKQTIEEAALTKFIEQDRAARAAKERMSNVVQFPAPEGEAN